MTIKKQLNLFIVAIIGIPLLSLMFVFAYNYYSSSERVLLRGYYQLRQKQKIEISEKDWSLIYRAIKGMPADMQAALIAQNSIVISTIPDLKERTVLSENQLWDILKESSRDYYYQFETPPLGTKENRIMLLSRINKVKQMRSRNFFTIVFLCFVIFVTICLVIVYSISRNIITSLMFLKEQAEVMTQGDLDVKIETDAKLNNEISSLTRNLDKMRIALKDSKDRRSHFIMGVSHDLRTPIAVIKGYTEAIADGMITDTEEIQKALSLVAVKTNQLEQMIDSLINYEKLQTTDLKDKLIETPLYPFLKSFAKNAQATGTIFHKNVSWNIEISKDVIVKMDTQLAQRALENVFSNALRYTQDGGSISISALETENQVTVFIADTGCGIDEKDKKNIFDLFYRASNSRQDGGMGIGLSVVKNIVELHNWKIDVESDKGRGTTFIITMNKE